MDLTRIAVCLLVIAMCSVGSGQPDQQYSRARILRQEPVCTPEIACAAGLEGSADVLVHVAPSGEQLEVELLGATHPVFGNRAKLIAWFSSYVPAVRDGIAVADTLHRRFVFSCDRPRPAAIEAGEVAPRERVVELYPNQFCLYGNWLSGPVVVRLSEDRVYIDGIRVHPSIACFNARFFSYVSLPEVLQEQLVFECRLFERELARRGIALERIRAETVDMLTSFTGVVSATVSEAGSISVETTDGERLVLDLPDPTDTGLYYRLQPKMASSEAEFYHWLWLAHPRLGARFVMFADGTSTHMAIGNDKANELRAIVSAAEKNSCGGFDLQNDIWSLSPGLVSLIECPAQIKRL